MPGLKKHSIDPSVAEDLGEHVRLRSAINRREALLRLATFAATPAVFKNSLLANVGGRLPSVSYHNIEECEPLDDGGWRLSRVPRTLRAHLNSNAQRRSYAPAGAELRFGLVSQEARIVLRKVEDRGEAARHLPALVEIYQGDLLVDWRPLADDWMEILVRRPPNREARASGSGGAPRFPPELVRVALPCLPAVQLLKIEGDVRPARNDEVPARRFLAYGSSITNGAHTVRPGDAYPARIARRLGMDAFNLGFGGGAHLEPEMAEWIAQRTDWEFATLELGINLVGRLTPEEFQKRLAAFLPKIAAARPDQWIFCIDLFTANGDFTQNPRYPAFRAAVRDAVAKIGSPRVVHFDGRELLSRASGLTLDLVHPSSDGFEEMADQLVRRLQPYLAKG
ncbi:MAG TPA: SGNH/GDSL hydrolase family protein [Opitutaceae bacterium]|nr:SGNH/GDSL hydrolase family protein [Opitutaceae bacterium]